MKAGLDIVLHRSKLEVGIKLFTVQISQILGIVGRVITADSDRVEKLIQHQATKCFKARRV